MWEIVNEVHHLTVNLVLGLVILIIVNGILNLLESLFEKTIDWKCFMEDCFKGFLIFICFLATYLVGLMNPDLVVISIFDGQNLNLEDAIAIMTVSAYFIYAKQIMEKLFAFIIAQKPLHSKEHCNRKNINEDEEKEKANEQNTTKNTPPLT